MTALSDCFQQYFSKIMDKFDSSRLDLLLKSIDESKGGKVSRDALLDEKDAPEDWHRAITFLTEEGYIKESGDHFEITYKGRVLIHEGGFRGEDRRERLLRHSSVIAAVCSLLGLLVALAAFLRQP